MTKDAAYTVVVACKHVEEGACIACVRNAIADAREEGRAAGYAEAIEKAAKVCDEEIALARQMMDTRTKQGLEVHGWQCRSTGARDIQDFIRALAPAATTEGPK